MITIPNSGLWGTIATYLNLNFAETEPVYHINTEGAQSINTEEPAFELINELDVTDDMPAGSYELLLGYAWSMPDTNDSALFRVDVQGTTGEIFRREPKDINDVDNRTVLVPYDHAGGVFNAKFYGSITTGGKTLSIERSSVRIRLEKRA